MGRLTYSVDPGIFDLAPRFCRAVVVAAGVRNAAEDAGLDARLRARIAAIKEDDSISEAHPRIAAWAEVYRRMPAAPGSRIRPSIGTIVRRLKTSDVGRFPFISSLVAISNLVSMTHLTPGGLIDAARVRGDLRLGFARGDESFLPFGRDAAEVIPAGEIIYFDTAGREVFCRAWNSQGSQSAGIQLDTSAALLDIDALLDLVPRDELEAAAAEAAEAIRRHCGGESRVFYLDASAPAFEVEV